MNELEIKSNGSIIKGILNIPKESKGIVIFAHGSGSSRHSKRNQYIAQILEESNIATLLIDLLTSEEEQTDNITTEYRFNIELLSNRVLSATNFIKNDVSTKNLNIAYFGASTGAAAAIAAAVKTDKQIRAIVSRGGRPDMAEEYLPQLTIPTLLIVGGLDIEVINLNNKAMNQMVQLEEKSLQIIPDASHLFPESGKLEEVSELAKNWFLHYL